MATYGYLNTNDGQPTENLLTNTKQRHLLVGDDLIFSNDKCKPLETFYRVPFDVKGEEFSHLSDHRGIALELSNKQKKRDWKICVHLYINSSNVGEPVLYVPWYEKVSRTENDSRRNATQ